MEKYYLICNRILGKRTDKGDFIYYDGVWTDAGNKIEDYLIGFDPSEEPGSPYAIGNTDIMEKIQEISFSQANEILNGRS